MNTIGYEQFMALLLNLYSYFPEAKKEKLEREIIDQYWEQCEELTEYQMQYAVKQIVANRGLSHDVLPQRWRDVIDRAAINLFAWMPTPPQIREIAKRAPQTRAMHPHIKLIEQRRAVEQGEDVVTSEQRAELKAKLNRIFSSLKNPPPSKIDFTAERNRQLAAMREAGLL